MAELKIKRDRLKKLRMRNRILNTVCIILAGSGLWWTATYFWRYFNYEVTNDAFIDQYVAPLNVRASGYIKEVRFKEHQYVKKGDTLLVLDNSEYLIKVKEAEAAGTRLPPFRAAAEGRIHSRTTVRTGKGFLRGCSSTLSSFVGTKACRPVAIYRG